MGGVHCSSMSCLWPGLVRSATVLLKRVMNSETLCGGVVSGFYRWLEGVFVKGVEGLVVVSAAS